MKTKSIIAALLCFAALSCVKENQTPDPVEKGELVTLEAIIEAPAATRIHFTGETELATLTSWEAEDRIWVRSDTQPYWERGDCFTTSAAAITNDGHSAAFTGRTRKDGRLAAVYPFAYVEEGSNNDLVKLDVPQSRALTANDCPPSSVYAAAFWADGATTFSMNYLVGAVKFSIKGNGEKVKRFELMDGNTSMALWGSLQVEPDYQNKGIASVSMLNDQASRNRVSLDADVTLGTTPVNFYFLLPEGALSSGLALKAFGEDGKVIARLTSDKDNSIVRGKVVRMPEIAMEPVSGGASFDGSGLEADPFLIANSDNLTYLAQVLGSETEYPKYADKFYLQTADIDMGGKETVPAGTIAQPFKGHYDGNGKTISNLTVTGLNSDNPASGVFGYVEDAVISNLTVTNRSNSGDMVRNGGVIGYAKNSTIDNCHISGGEFGAGANMLGGIVGDMVGGSVTNCTAANVKLSQSKNYAAGIVAYAHGGAVIEKCKVLSGTVVSGANEIGGIVGKMEGGHIKECSAEGAYVSSSSEDVGAIGGWVISECQILNCTVTGSSVTVGTNYGGGFVGLLEKSTIKDCTLTGKSAVTGNKSGTGGFVGYAKSTGISNLENCLVDGECVINGVSNTGGLVGWVDAANLKNCTVTGKAQILSSKDGTGGLVGRAICKSGNDNWFDGCKVNGDVLVKGLYSVGGLVGYAYPDSNGNMYFVNSGVSDATVYGTLCDTGGDPAKGDCMNAGILGWARFSDAGSKGWIVNCYSYLKSMVLDLNMSHPSVGGIVGYTSLSSTGQLEIVNCVSTFVKETLTMAGAAFDPATPQAGTLYGWLPSNAGVRVSGNYYISGDLGIGGAGANAVIETNYGVTEDVLKDGETVKTALNAFVSGQSTYTLKAWTASAGSLPMFE